MLRDHGDKVPAADKQATETALGELREALKTDDLDRIKKAQEAVTQASHKLAEAMYRDAQGQAQQGAAGAPQSGAPAGSAGGNAAPKGDVVDAEFEDLGEKK
jgi:molecular chaperone DnaK